MSLRRKRKEKGRVQNQKIQRKRSVPKDDLHLIFPDDIKEKLREKRVIFHWLRENK